MFNQVLQVLGLIFLGILSVGIVMLAFSLLVEAISSLYDRWRYNHAIETIHRIGECLKREKYWYSESKEAMELLEVIGDAYMTTSSTYVSMNPLRDRWRAKLNE